MSKDNTGYENDEEYESDIDEKKQEKAAPAQPTLDTADDGFSFTPASSTQSTPSISTLSDTISHDGQTSDPITKAVRETIIQPQKDEIAEQILKDLAALVDRDLAEQKRKEIEEEKEKIKR